MVGCVAPWAKKLYFYYNSSLLATKKRKNQNGNFWPNEWVSIQVHEIERRPMMSSPIEKNQLFVILASVEDVPNGQNREEKKLA